MTDDFADMIQSKRELQISSLIAGRYARGRQIYRSANSIVYHGLDTVSGDAVVVKKLPDGACSRRIAEFHREGMILRQQTHPGLIHGEGYFASHRQHWLVMEPARGTLLLDLFASGNVLKWSASLRHKICANMVSAVTALHKMGWEHGDIKPDNLFVDPASGHITLIDYSATRKIGEPGNNQSCSCKWANPYRNNQYVDFSKDIYGLGMIFWYFQSRPSPDSMPLKWIWLLKRSRASYRLTKYLSNPGNLNLSGLITIFDS